MKIVVDKMPKKMEDCPRHYIAENGVGDKWDACNGASIGCMGVEKCPFYVGFDELMKGNIKAADADPVIRCRDCKYSRELNHEDPKERQFIEGCVWCMNWEYGVFPDDYCSNAKKKEDENNGTHQ